MDEKELKQLMKRIKHRGKQLQKNKAFVKQIDAELTRAIKAGRLSQYMRHIQKLSEAESYSK